MTRTSLLRPHVDAELTAARVARRAGDVDRSWLHLERAHILSQPSARLHGRVHAWMLAAAVRDLDAREALGQVLRFSGASVASFFGRYPIGNTGRARVPIMKPMPIPADLRALLDDVERRSAAAEPRSLDRSRMGTR
jgi:hypothetical protein